MDINAGQNPRPRRKIKKMQNDTTNLFRRRDTMFGICEALGQDFGFNPTWLRLAFIAPLFFFPVQTIVGYFGLGAAVLVSRLVFPRKDAAPAQSLVATEAKVAERPAEVEQEFALAA